MTDQEILRIYIDMVKFWQKVLGPGCEIAVHDLTNPEQSLVAIENNISGRKVGSSLTDLARNLAEQGTYRDVDYVVNYSGKTKKTDFLSSTYFIKNEGRLIGMLCINKDISDIKHLNNMFAHFQEYFNLAAPEESEYSEDFDSPVNNIMHLRIKEVIAQSGVSPNRMSIEEKVSIIQRLQESGVTTMKGAVSEIANQLSISVPTVYRYMKKATTPRNS